MEFKIQKDRKPYIIPKSPVSKYYVPLFYRTEISDVKYLAHKS